MTSAATIAMMTPTDAYTLGMLDERLRQAERLREEIIERTTATTRPKAPKKPAADAKPNPREPELPRVNGDAVSANGEAVQTPVIERTSL